MKEATLIEQLQLARKRATPLICIRTADPQVPIKQIVAEFGKDAMIFNWDTINGIVGVSQRERDLMANWKSKDTTNAVVALELAYGFPDGAILIMSNAQRYIQAGAPAQAIWNLRQPYKLNRRTLILLCPDVQLPAELSQDVMVLDDPLPGEELLAEIITKTCQAAKCEVTPEFIEKTVSAVSGLSAFSTEQTLAMSFSRSADGQPELSLENLWRQKKQVIEQTPGLELLSRGDNFENIRGYENLKRYLRQFITSKRPPRGVVVVEELEKAIAGAGTDSSGTTQDQLGTLLTYMEDHQANGIILVGPPGTSKSQFAKSYAGEAAIPCINFDMGAMKAGLVGESEKNIRAALKVVSSVTQDRAFFLASCNSIGKIPPELRRRFRAGIFFLDLPDSLERASIWSLYVEKFGLGGQPHPIDTDWTGAEIKQCCMLAADFGCTLLEAAEYVVPVAVSAAEELQALRELASNRFISASHPGKYTHGATQAMTGAREVAERTAQDLRDIQIY